MPTGDGVHGVNSGDTGSDHFFGIDLELISAQHPLRDGKPCTYTRVGVDGAAVDVKVVLSQYFGTLVDSSSGPVEYSTKHVFRDTNLEVVACEFDFGLARVSDNLPMSQHIAHTFFTSIPDVPSKTYSL